MKREYKIYGIYLELHDHHTLWEITEPISMEMYNAVVGIAIDRLEEHFKNLTVYCEGRSGRHICIDDTPVNRRRFSAVQDYALRLEKAVIQYCNKGGIEHCPISDFDLFVHRA